MTRRANSPLGLTSFGRSPRKQGDKKTPHFVRPVGMLLLSPRLRGDRSASGRARGEEYVRPAASSYAEAAAKIWSITLMLATPSSGGVGTTVLFRMALEKSSACTAYTSAVGISMTSRPGETGGSPPA